MSGKLTKVLILNYQTVMNAEEEENCNMKYVGETTSMSIIMSIQLRENTLTSLAKVYPT